MLNFLHNLIDNKLHGMLEKPELWDSLLINRRKPFTYRVFAQFDAYRVCLHKFEACDTSESFCHPHPWPGAFCILQGAYNMNLYLSKDKLDVNPELVSKLTLDAVSSYEISNPLTWHQVIPLVDTYTIMVNSTPWTPEVAHTAVRTTKGKDLQKLSPQQLQDHLDVFKRLV